MIKLNVRMDINKALMKLGAISDSVRNRAVPAALNKTIDKGKAEMVRQITAEYNVKAKDVRPQLQTSRASAKNGKMVATLVAFGRRRGHSSRNVIMFDAKQVAGNGAPRKVRVQFPNGEWRTIIVRDGGGVSVKIKKNGARKLIKGAFIGNQGRTVFVRTGDGRKIRAVETVDIPQMFNTRRVHSGVMERMRSEFPVELERAIKLYLSR